MSKNVNEYENENEEEMGFDSPSSTTTTTTTMSSSTTTSFSSTGSKRARAAAATTSSEERDEEPHDSYTGMRIKPPREFVISHNPSAHLWGRRLDRFEVRLDFRDPARLREDIRAFINDRTMSLDHCLNMASIHLRLLEAIEKSGLEGIYGDLFHAKFHRRRTPLAARGGAAYARIEVICPRCRGQILHADLDESDSVLVFRESVRLHGASRVVSCAVGTCLHKPKDGSFARLKRSMTPQEQRDLDLIRQHELEVENARAFKFEFDLRVATARNPWLAPDFQSEEMRASASAKRRRPNHANTKRAKSGEGEED